MGSITELFCQIDDFCKHFESKWKKHLISSGQRQRIRSCALSLSEIITIVVLFHQSRYRQFKHYYNHYILQSLRAEFPTAPSYSWMVTLKSRSLAALSVLFENLKGQVTGISIVDSTPIAVCHNLRIKRHKTFKNHAQRGKSSTGWFYGFKLHAVINHLGELLSVRVTPGNIDDRSVVVDLSQTLYGKLLADKGYLSKSLFGQLAQKGIQLIHKVRKNMKAIVLDRFDASLLRHRSVIETVFDQLKNLTQIEHTRHRSITHFAVNLMSGLVAYCLQPKKPRMPIHVVSPDVLG